MKKIITAITVLLALGFLTSCGSCKKHHKRTHHKKTHRKAAVPDKPAPKVFTVDSLYELRVKLKDTFDISLDANFGTGFSWYPADTLKEVQLVDYQTSQKVTDSGGVVDVQKWRWMALKPGSYNMDFIYRRPWEKKPKDAKTYRMTILVTK